MKKNLLMRLLMMLFLCVGSAVMLTGCSDEPPQNQGENGTGTGGGEAKDPNNVAGTLWRVNHSYEGGYNSGTTLRFGSSTAVLSIIEKQGNTTLTTEYNFSYRQSGNLVILTPQQEGIATLEGRIESDIKMTITNTSNDAVVCVMYKE